MAAAAAIDPSETNLEKAVTSTKSSIDKSAEMAILAGVALLFFSSNRITALAQLFTSPYLYSGLLGRFVNLEALLEYLAEEHVSGSVVVQTPNEAGIILLHDGDILGTYTESQRSLDKATTAVATLAADRESVIANGTSAT